MAELAPAKGSLAVHLGFIEYNATRNFLCLLPRAAEARMVIELYWLIAFSLPSAGFSYFFLSSSPYLSSFFFIFILPMGRDPIWQTLVFDNVPIALARLRTVLSTLSVVIGSEQGYIFFL